MFKNVIWATDGSQAADSTLALARQLARAGPGRLIVVHCVELTMPGKAGGSVTVHADEHELSAKIEQQVTQLAQDGIDVELRTSRIHSGGAAHVIADLARSEHADVIVVGTRGLTPLAGLLLGSVTQRLLHIAPCPVLAVPTAGRDTNA
jgi:nucleotide-binding universal stress UspA family protein